MKMNDGCKSDRRQERNDSQKGRKLRIPFSVNIRKCKKCSEKGKEKSSEKTFPFASFEEIESSKNERNICNEKTRRNIEIWKQCVDSENNTNNTSSIRSYMLIPITRHRSEKIPSNKICNSNNQKYNHLKSS